MRHRARRHSRPLGEIAGWVEDNCRFWEQSFDRLDEYLREVKDRELKDKEKKHGRKQRRE